MKNSKYNIKDWRAVKVALSKGYPNFLLIPSFIMLGNRPGDLKTTPLIDATLGCIAAISDITVPARFHRSHVTDPVDETVLLRLVYVSPCFGWALRKNMLQIIRRAFKIKILPRSLTLDFEQDIAHYFFVAAVRSPKFLIGESGFERIVIGIYIS